MALLAVNKNGMEIISDYDLYRNGYRKKYKTCDLSKCAKCPKNSELFARLIQTGVNMI